MAESIGPESDLVASNGHIAAGLEDTQPVDRVALRSDIEDHLRQLGLWDRPADAELSKQNIRDIHNSHRTMAHAKIRKALGERRIREMIEAHIANGDEVDPEKIEPAIELVNTEKLSRIFRFATLFWSVPASMGYGRRMRFLVRDRRNGKLIGVFALCDPVFNLTPRDDWIGWDQAGRRARLVHTMSAYVVGAVRPYSDLLGGKLVTSLIASREVGKMFDERYGHTAGIISGQRKNARLTLVTFTSALGRSSIYNRVRLYNGSSDHPVVALDGHGYTKGFGHFQIREEHFRQLRQILVEDEHSYISPRMGTGPNWKIRVVRAGLEKIGFEEADAVLRHGIRREVYVMPIADNAKKFLAGQDESPLFDNQYDASAVSELARKRWVIPRASRRPGFRAFRRSEVGTDVLCVRQPDFKACSVSTY